MRSGCRRRRAAVSRLAPERLQRPPVQHRRTRTAPGACRRVSRGLPPPRAARPWPRRRARRRRSWARVSRARRRRAVHRSRRRPQPAAAGEGRHELAPAQARDRRSELADDPGDLKSWHERPISGIAGSPRRAMTSMKLIPAAATSIETCPGPGDGVATSTSALVVASVGALKARACIPAMVHPCARTAIGTVHSLREGCLIVDESWRCDSSWPLWRSPTRCTSDALPNASASPNPRSAS